MAARKRLPRRLDDPREDLVNLLREGAVTPEQLRLLVGQKDDAMKAEVERIVAAHTTDAWRSDPMAMAAYLTDGAITNDRPYQQFLARKFKQLLRDAPDRSPRQVWNLPAQYGKSTVVHAGLLYALDLYPQSKSIYTGYGDSLMLEGAIWVRDMLRAHGDVLATQLRPDRRRMDRFVTDQGGGLLAKGMFSGIVGFGVNEWGGLVIDDPMKGWQEAHNPNARQRTQDTYTGTLRHRLASEHAYILIVHHRYQLEDLSGYLKAQAEAGLGEEFEMVVLPELAGDDDPLGREPGEPLDPNVASREQIERKHLALTTYVAAAVSQQAPMEEQGTMIRRAWFRLEEETPTSFDQAGTSWDFKMKDNEVGDWVVGQAWGRTGADYHCVDQLRGQWDHATSQNAVALMAVRHPHITTHWVEAAAAAPEIVAALREPQDGYVVSEDMRGRLNCTELEARQVEEVRRRGLTGLVFNKVTDGDKQVRARTFIVPAAEPGHVVLPAYATWVPAFLAEMAAFPGGTKDQVDAASQALKKLGVGEAVLAVSNRQVTSVQAGAARQAPGGSGATAAASARSIGRRR